MNTAAYNKKQFVDLLDNPPYSIGEGDNRKLTDEGVEAMKELILQAREYFKEYPDFAARLLVADVDCSLESILSLLNTRHVEMNFVKKLFIMLFFMGSYYQIPDRTLERGVISDELHTVGFNLSMLDYIFFNLNEVLTKLQNNDEFGATQIATRYGWMELRDFDHINEFNSQIDSALITSGDDYYYLDVDGLENIIICAIKQLYANPQSRPYLRVDYARFIRNFPNLMAFLSINDERPACANILAVADFFLENVRSSGRTDFGDNNGFTISQKLGYLKDLFGYLYSIAEGSEEAKESIHSLIL
jgi:hypothetical protein